MFPTSSTENVLVRALLVHPARQGFLTIMRYTNPLTHSLTHSLVWLGAPAQHTGIHTASKARCGSKHAINHAALSYLTAINAHVQTQPVIGHLPQTPAPSPENNPRGHRVGTAGRCPQL